MKTKSAAALFLQLFAVCFSAIAASQPSSASLKAPAVLIKNVSGEATFSNDGKIWQPLTKSSIVDQGTTIKTGADGAVDFILDFSSTVLRLVPESELEFARLDRTPVDEVVITDTKLKLMAGSIIGSQRKLSHLSRFVIETPDGIARIVGTEYVVRFDGAVSVLSGSVTLTYKKPRGGTLSFTVGEDQTFDPNKGKVVPTTNEYLRKIIAGVYTVRATAETYKIGKATLIVRTKKEKVSKSECDDEDVNNHGGGKGDDGGRGGKNK